MIGEEIEAVGSVLVDVVRANREPNDVSLVLPHRRAVLERSTTVARPSHRPDVLILNLVYAQGGAKNSGITIRDEVP